MGVALWIILYVLIGFQHARIWTRDELEDKHSGDLLVPIWIIGFPLWPVVDLVWLVITLCENFPTAARRLVVAAPPRAEKKQLKRKELEARVAELEAELDLDT